MPQKRKAGMKRIYYGSGDPREWVTLAGKWSHKKGVWSPRGEQSNLLVWQQPAPLDFVFTCEGWIDRKERELTLVARHPSPKIPTSGLHSGCSFQYGGELSTCTTIRTVQVVKAIRRLHPAVMRKYKIEFEYRGTTFMCRIDGKEVLSYEAMFPIPGSHLGLYSWGAGAHFRILDIRIRPYGSEVRAMHTADRLFENNLYELALDEYNLIAGSSNSPKERSEALLKAGFCCAQLSRVKEARRIFTSLGKTPVAPFALAGAAKLDLHEGPGANAARAVNLFRRLTTRFPGSAAKAEIIPAIYSLPNSDSLFRSAVDRLEIRAQLEALGRETCRPVTQFQVQCQVDRTMHLMELGRWKAAFNEWARFEEKVPREHYRLVSIEPALIAAALANGREDLVPASPFSLSCWDSNISHSNMGTVIHGPIRHRAVERFIADVKRLPPKAGDEFFREQSVALAFLAKGDVAQTKEHLESAVLPLLQHTTSRLHWLLWTIVDSRSEELFDFTMQWLNARVSPSGAQKDKAEEMIARAGWALEAGELGKAARLLNGVHFNWQYSRGIMYQLLLSSLGVLSQPAPRDLQDAVERTMAGTSLNLAHMFLGKSKPVPNALWPHRLWSPHLRLWLTLWLEARGKRKAALSIASAALDERYGLTFSQPALRAAVERLA
jgi:hypothetical protein